MATAQIATSEVDSASIWVEAGEDRQGGDEEDTAADADQPAGHSAREPQRHDPEHLARIHQTTSSTAMTTSRSANRAEIARSGIRCWRAAPATTPASAGPPTSAASPSSTLP